MNIKNRGHTNFRKKLSKQLKQSHETHCNILNNYEENIAKVYIYNIYIYRSNKLNSTLSYRPQSKNT